uniref:Tyrosine-protein phosphatase domain-containing protein n=1 Tax=Panagrolaimus davidi TaxID=227884 RepID=A0A914QW55_9BILA
MAVRAKHHITISTQDQFINDITTKPGGELTREWNQIQSPQKYPSVAFEQEEKRASKYPDHLRKNRYRSIELNDFQRILMGANGYFRGNYASVIDFRKVVLQEKCAVTVALCNTYEEAIEGGKSVMKEKSAQYYPVERTTPLLLGEFQVLLKKVTETVYTVNKDEREIIAVSRFEIRETQKTGLRRSGKLLHYVIHVNYELWSDLGVPKLTQPIIDIYNEFVEPSIAKNCPVAIHCSA